MTGDCVVKYELNAVNVKILYDYFWGVRIRQN